MGGTETVYLVEALKHHRRVALKAANGRWQSQIVIVDNWFAELRAKLRSQ